jgi:putative membrane protein
VAVAEHVFFVGSLSLSVSVSIGCASPGRLEHASAAALIRLADLRLYEAKQTGRGRVVAGGFHWRGLDGALRVTDNRPVDDPSKLGADPRVIFAAERTLLAWIRTGIGLMGFGFIVARFAGDSARANLEGVVVGAGLVLVGALVNAWASFRHHQIVCRLMRGETEIRARGPVMLGVTTVIGGLVLIAALLGSWFK